MNDVPPKPYAQNDDEEDPRRFCPVAHQIIPGPLGQVTIRRPMCEPEHCKLADPRTGACRIAETSVLLLRIAIALEQIAKELPKLRPI